MSQCRPWSWWCGIHFINSRIEHTSEMDRLAILTMLESWTCAWFGRRVQCLFIEPVLSPPEPRDDFAVLFFQHLLQPTTKNAQHQHLALDKCRSLTDMLYHMENTMNTSQAVLSSARAAQTRGNIHSTPPTAEATTSRCRAFSLGEPLPK